MMNEPGLYVTRLSAREHELFVALGQRLKQACEEQGRKLDLLAEVYPIMGALICEECPDLSVDDRISIGTKFIREIHDSSRLAQTTGLPS
jgi:hypothetical protein